MWILDESGEGLHKIKELLRMRVMGNINVKCKCKKCSRPVGMSEINKYINKILNDPILQLKIHKSNASGLLKAEFVQLNNGFILLYSLLTFYLFSSYLLLLLRSKNNLSCSRRIFQFKTMQNDNGTKSKIYQRKFIL